MSVTLSPISFTVDSINEEDAIDDVEVYFETSQMEVTMQLTEAQASKLAFQLANILQDIANQRTADAEEAAYDLNEQKRIAAWKRTQQFKKSINTLQELR